MSFCFNRSAGPDVAGDSAGFAPSAAEIRIAVTANNVLKILYRILSMGMLAGYESLDTGAQKLGEPFSQYRLAAEFGHFDGIEFALLFKLFVCG